MPQHLELRFRRDTDGTGELTVHVQRDQYAGCSSAWFHDREIEEFGRSLIEFFPPQRERKIFLQGGCWKSGATPPEIDETLVGIDVYAVDSTGTIGVKVDLREGRAEGLREDSRAKLVVELLTDYEPLRAFGHNILNLVRSHDAVATMTSAA